MECSDSGRIVVVIIHDDMMSNTDSSYCSGLSLGLLRLDHTGTTTTVKETGFAGHFAWAIIKIIRTFYTCLFIIMCYRYLWHMKCISMLS